MTAHQIQPILKDIKMPKGEAVSDNRLTLAEYVEREESSTVKHEFHNGQIVEMAGGAPPHAQVAGNFLTFLNFCLYKKTNLLLQKWKTQCLELYFLYRFIGKH
jgi:Uma2 family endonuclease